MTDRQPGALAADDERYRLLAENADDFVVFVGTDNRIRWANPGVTATLGWDRAELVGRLVTDVLHPDDHEVLLGQHAAARAAGGSSSGPAPEVRVRTKDGGYRWMAARIATLRGAHDEQLGGVAAFRDMEAVVAAREALQASETRYAEMADRLPVGLFTIRLRTDGTFAFDYFSPPAGRLFQVDPGAVMRDAGAAFAPIHPDDIAGLIESSREAARTREPYRWEGRFVIDEETRWVRIESAPDPRSAGSDVVFHGFVEDVTRRHHAEEALAASEADLAEAQRIGKTGGFTWDARTDTAAWSREVCALYGFDPASPPTSISMLGAHLPPGGAAAVRAAIGHLMATHEPSEFEHEYVRADGAIGWMLSRLQPMREPDGMVVGVRGTQTDITDLKRAEAAVRESEELYRSIVAISPDTIALTTLDGVLTFFSPSGVGLFGLAGPEEALGRPITDFIVPEDRARAMEGIIERIARGRPGPAVFGALRADGSRFELEVNGAPRRDASGAVIGFVFVVRDVTAQHRAAEALRISEERHRLIAENALDVIWTMAPDGRITSISPSVEKLRGYTVAEAMAQPLDEILTTASAMESTNALIALVTEATAGHEPAPYRGEQEYLCRDGSTIWCDVMARVILAPDGSIAEILGVSRDISERKRAEAELIAARDAAEAANARYLDLVERLPVGVYLFRNRAGGEFAFDYLSPQAERLLGIDGRAALADPQAGLATIHPDDLPAMFALSEATRAANMPFHWEGRCVVAGETRVVRIDADPTPGDDGWTRWHGIAADVTEARRAEEAVRASQALASAVVQGTADVVYVKDTDGRMLLINDVAARVIGRPAASMVGLDENAWFPPEIATAIIEADRAVLSTGTTLTVDETIVDASGALRTYLMSKSRLLEPDGGVIGLLAVGRDITERRAIEESLRAREAELTEAQRIAHIGSWTISVDGTGSWSDEMFRIHGIHPAEGMPPLDEYGRFMAPADFARVRAAIARCLEDGEPYELEHEIRRPDGEVRYIRSRAAAVWDRDGQVVGIHGTHQDITTERELEARLRQAQRLEAVGQLAGGVAHDFNNLLAAMRGYTELAREAIPRENPASADLDDALSVADRAAALTRQLLAFSRRQPLQLEVIDPADVVDSLVPMLRRLLGEHIELTTSHGADLGRIRVDPGQLEQVVVNLAVNARDAMRDGGRLSISLQNAAFRPAADPADGADRATAPAPVQPCVRMAVADTGTGIDPDVLPRIFEPFFTTKGVGEGSGMGLATVYGIVGASGGRIGVDSEVGHGTTFTIDLPRVDLPESPDDEGSGPDPEAAAAARGAMGGETVLLVEDEASVRRVTARMLRGLGYVVVEVGGPAEALAIDDEAIRSVDLLVSDVIMPGMNGPRLAELLEERRGGRVAVVLVSGYAPDPSVAVRLDQPGAAFVSKPFDSTALAIAARKALEGSRGAD